RADLRLAQGQALGVSLVGCLVDVPHRLLHQAPHLVQQVSRELIGRHTHAATSLTTLSAVASAPLCTSSAACCTFGFSSSNNRSNSSPASWNSSRTRSPRV